ncbi:hypothetical protein H9Y04_26635 [Streptomyces sp. TRM66268-LWL]|uniref:Ankyrin n=1 Tax=Streptomyces polyasparticus TaxID=2767826 RepID=A0ABR7SLC2_9ACTN|nr:hypothetical protein [Streptomyces polyasparticus]MBC9716119.1 hypothetical protein [Streptomyces polyasparticus]
MYEHHGAPTAPEPPTARYEAHVTVRCEDAEAVALFGKWAAREGLKTTHIVLARGRMRSQPMLTLRETGSFAAQLASARAVAGRLRAAGFDPVRIKVESTPWAPEVPARPTGREHFEHHVKLLLDEDFDRAALTAVAVAHGAHLSWNARRVRDGGRHERFVTQRCFGVPAAEAGRALERLLVDLAGYEVLGMEREFVLFDSDLSVDDGWIGEPA